DGIRDFHVTGVQTCALPISEIQSIQEAHQQRNTILKKLSQTIASKSEKLKTLNQDRAALENVVKKLETTSSVKADQRDENYKVRSEERRVGKECRTGSS